MSETPKADASQLRQMPTNYAADELAKANGLADDAKRAQAGLPFVAEGDRAVLEKRAQDAQAYATTQINNAQGDAARYNSDAFAVKTYNEPIEAQLRAQQEAAAAARAAELAKFALTAVAVTAVAETSTQPGGISGAFGRMFGLGQGEPATTMSMGGPSSMFNSRGASPAAFGLTPSLDKVLGPVMAAVAIDDVAKKSPDVAAAMAEPTVTAAAPARAATPASTGTNMELHNNMLANGPKKPSWANNGTPNA